MNPNNFQVGNVYSLLWADTKVHYFLIVKQKSECYYCILREDVFVQDCYLGDDDFRMAKLIYES